MTSLARRSTEQATSLFRRVSARAPYPIGLGQAEPAGGHSRSSLSYRGPMAGSRSPPSQRCGRAARCMYLLRVARRSRCGLGEEVPHCTLDAGWRLLGVASVGDRCPTPLDRNFLQLLSDARTAWHRSAAQQFLRGAAPATESCHARPCQAKPCRAIPPSPLPYR